VKVEGMFFIYCHGKVRKHFCRESLNKDTECFRKLAVFIYCMCVKGIKGLKD
jgi:hypothetical protein